jgi:imidazole glycerol-phosphate synthase subunit HisH
VIAIVDYGAGNLASVMKGLRAAGAEPRVARGPRDLAGTIGIVIPGVGHFDATRSLDAAWRGAIRSLLDRDVPLLGICLGMQWLFEGSDEAADVPGLGLLPGRVFRLTGPVKVPHVGWNGVSTIGPSPLLAGVPDGAETYFTHTYAAPLTAAAVARTDHGVPFASIVDDGRAAGMQFHPEKSGRVGIRLLANWVGRCSVSG